MESFFFEYRLSCPPHTVFAELADPSYIERIAPFKVKVTHVRDGQGHRNGVGSIRRIQPWFKWALEPINRRGFDNRGRQLEQRSHRG